MGILISLRRTRLQQSYAERHAANLDPRLLSRARSEGVRKKVEKTDYDYEHEHEHEKQRPSN